MMHSSLYPLSCSSAAYCLYPLCCSSAAYCSGQILHMSVCSKISPAYLYNYPPPPPRPQHVNIRFKKKLVFWYGQDKFVPDLIMHCMGFFFFFVISVVFPDCQFSCSILKKKGNYLHLVSLSAACDFTDIIICNWFFSFYLVLCLARWQQSFPFSF